jgi:MFS family permease
VERHVPQLGLSGVWPSVINPAMAKAVGLNREALGNMLMVYMIMSGLPGPLVAMSVNRFGVRKTLVAGSLFTISGALLMANVVTGALGGMLCYGLLVGTGVATGAAMASQAGLARWFVRRRSLALSVLYSAGAIGGIVAAPLLDWLIGTTRSWRAGWWLLAALSTVAACIALTLGARAAGRLGAGCGRLRSCPRRRQTGSGYAAVVRDPPGMELSRCGPQPHVLAAAGLDDRLQRRLLDVPGAWRRALAGSWPHRACRRLGGERADRQRSRSAS